jgi:DNA-directed RNA polymerase II subunit RPB1
MTPPQDEDSRDVTTRLYNHGGCGNAQPVIRKDGLKLWGSWKKSSKDPEVV